MQVSVIMPVYNASEFLDASIGSIKSQDYSDWELICVDDGSEDDSLSILKDYASKDHRIKVYSQANGGPAQARKLGISHASGEYISYLDSDDSYSEDYLSSTMQAAVEHNADVVMPTMKMYTCMIDGEPLDFNVHHGLEVGQEIPPRVAFMKTFPWKVHGFCLYRADHIKKYALTDISSVNNYNADEFLTRHLLLYASKIVVSGGAYCYGVNDESITRKFSMRKLSALKVDELLFELARKEAFTTNELRTLANYFFRNLVSLRLQVIKNRNSLSMDQRAEAMRALRKDYSWKSHISIRSPRMLRIKAAAYLPGFLVDFLYSLRGSSQPK